ncbi:1-acyldihydroxyacetone phosphate reductase [Schizosaccharomyces cryophilus OY26]|uniref:1-acyldihydroxyacetone phosphate reductase n=1 Tax=Schizosaccharomyces cryophilus (strain OY26 / ATCC MYA-4695 / CBS 11777 / NBRC 106824 / NRRL Y48691) TaxID=653667 RepID=S9X4F0_SCHCR|nr:1-acyldihydroxyacetone phosphate reductase [Schizosaccharomyces cryophilus OY26]EPY51947.1 1-acyldihydroxyacetone phosphate reductase [Schizosaccharomyces cryophilus OY26]
MSNSTENIVITGCSEGGIGNALAIEFHKQGYKVFATSRRLESMSNLIDMGIQIVQMDVTDDTSVSEAEKVIRNETGGKLHYLINNAGQPLASPAIDLEIPIVHNLMEVNLYGVMRTNTVFQKQLIRAKGTIVHTNSIASYVPLVFQAAYNASKAALLAYANTLRVELAPFGVQVTSIMTGLISTSVFKKPNSKLNEESISVNSIYYPYRTDLLSAPSFGDKATMSAQQYAEEVFQKLTARGRWYQSFRKGVRPAQLWAGQHSQLIRMASFFPIEGFTLPVRFMAKLPANATIDNDNDID